MGYLRCSNNAEFSNIGDNWYRIQNKNGYFYSYAKSEENYLGAQTDYIATIDECDQSNVINIQELYGDNWECTANIQYEICDSGHGIFLKEKSLINTKLSEEGSPIILEKPRIIGNPDEGTLSDIDEIVKSIKLGNE